MFTAGSLQRFIHILNTYKRPYRGPFRAVKASIEPGRGDRHSERASQTGGCALGDCSPSSPVQPVAAGAVPRGPRNTSQSRLNASLSLSPPGVLPLLLENCPLVTPRGALVKRRSFTSSETCARLGGGRERYRSRAARLGREAAPNGARRARRRGPKAVRTAALAAAGAMAA
jgi:hypothetical protein